MGYSNGPRCSPVIDGDRVYVMSADGVLQCLDLLNGHRRWRRDTSNEFDVQPNMYGVGSTPTVFNNLLLVAVGGYHNSAAKDSAAGIVAFDKLTGDVRHALSDTQASYASIQVTDAGGTPIAFALMREGIVAFDPHRGTQFAFQPWAAKVSGCVNAATPVANKGQVFISEAYGPGSALLTVSKNRFQILWRDPVRSRERAFRAHTDADGVDAAK